MPTFIELPKNEPTLDEQTARELIANADRELNERMGRHTVDFRTFWTRPGTTPEGILSAMGTAAARYIAGAGENVESMARLAGIMGKTLDEVWPRGDYLPPRKFVFERDGDGNFTGRVTLEPLSAPTEEPA